MYMSTHFPELLKIFTALKEDRKTTVQDTHPGPRIRYVLNLNGGENRPYSDKELKDLLKYYDSFKEELKENKVWPVRKLN